MAVVPVPGRGGQTTYLVADETARKVAIVHPQADTSAQVHDLAAERGWTLSVELRCQHEGRLAPTAPTVLQPERRLDRGRVVLIMPAGRLRLRIPSEHDTLSPDDTLDTFVVRLGKLEIFALACAANPTELAWRVGPAIFTGRLLYGEGVWPMSATPGPVLRLPSAYAIYPRIQRSDRRLSTVGREREWELTWRTRGYDPTVPDPSATVPPLSRAAGPRER